uniref:Calcyclin-binding protein n=1 Tax=Astyanax mexicanus TaxID=7994 RepID=A0A8B9H7M0_ASTMX
MLILWSFIQIAGLEADLQEVTRVLELCESSRVREVLSQEKQKIEKELKQKQSRREAGERPDTAVKGYTVKINNYGWDQSDKFVKIYITLKGVHKVPENVEVKFTERYFNPLFLRVLSLWIEPKLKFLTDDINVIFCFVLSKSSYDENADPGEGLMNMLKKIYSEGDDEMKRTINKAWSESQEKKSRGDDFDF